MLFSLIKKQIFPLLIILSTTSLHATTKTSHISEKTPQPKLLSDFPDLGGLVNFSHCRQVSNTLFILTNPKSGSHLLTYSIIKITGRPMRGRLPLWYFLNDPPCFDPENIMNYPLDFTKPTMYFGHEYFTLQKINKNKNKLIFINRDYKENLLSQIILSKKLSPIKDHETSLEEAFKEEILQNGLIFTEFLHRLKVFDSWNPNYRCLVEFKDLVQHPELFIPKVMHFIEDDAEYESFIENYDSFKKELLEKYRLRDNNTGSESDLKFFRKFLSKETLHQIDTHMAITYPGLWIRYLQQFQEQD